MRVSRPFALAVLYVLDNWTPPAIRDSRWFMRLPMRLAVGRHVEDFMTFKRDVFGMTPEQFSDLYRRTSSAGSLQGETDLNKACIDEIRGRLRYKDVLEVGCGRGHLAGILAADHNVTACDIVLEPGLPAKYPSVEFKEGNIEALPFADNSFDAVVCTHTLEHVQNLPRAISELRRVAARQLVVVVPRQRPYAYGFNLHTQFFPYAWSLQGALGYREGAVIKNLGDWYYEENYRADTDATAPQHADGVAVPSPRTDEPAGVDAGR